jgi:hypothetical protein
MVIVWVTLIALPQSSVTEYVRVMTSGQVLPSETSPTCATTGAAVQLSASSVTTETSEAGTSADTLDRYCQQGCWRWVCGVVDGNGLGNVDHVAAIIRYRVGAGDDLWTSIAVRNIAHECYCWSSRAVVRLVRHHRNIYGSWNIRSAHWTVTAAGLLAVGTVCRVVDGNGLGNVDRIATKDHPSQNTCG